MVSLLQFDVLVNLGGISFWGLPDIAIGSNMKKVENTHPCCESGFSSSRYVLATAR